MSPSGPLPLSKSEEKEDSSDINDDHQRRRWRRRKPKPFDLDEETSLSKGQRKRISIEQLVSADCAPDEDPIQAGPSSSNAFELVSEEP